MCSQCFKLPFNNAEKGKISEDFLGEYSIYQSVSDGHKSEKSAKFVGLHPTHSNLQKQP